MKIGVAVESGKQLDEKSVVLAMEFQKKRHTCTIKKKSNVLGSSNPYQIKQRNMK
jgi:hypothetical protein